MEYETVRGVIKVIKVIKLRNFNVKSSLYLPVQKFVKRSKDHWLPEDTSLQVKVAVRFPFYSNQILVMFYFRIVSEKRADHFFHLYVALT